MVSTTCTCTSVVYCLCLNINFDHFNHPQTTYHMETHNIWNYMSAHTDMHSSIVSVCKCVCVHVCVLFPLHSEFKIVWWVDVNKSVYINPLSLLGVSTVYHNTFYFCFD